MRRRLRRAEVAIFFARVEPYLIGVEASGGAQYWFRMLSRLGHTVRLIAPHFVRPYVKSQEAGNSRCELRLIESQQNLIVGLILAVTNPESVDAFFSEMS